MTGALDDVCERVFRVAGVDDLALVRMLTENAYASYLPILGYPPQPMTEDYLPRITAGEVRLVEVAGTVVGLLVLEQHVDHAMIYSVAVLPDRQREGHGHALLRLAEKEARRCGSPELRLYTNARMERNIALYATAGFSETGRRPHPRRADSTVVDMAKRLI